MNLGLEGKQVLITGGSKGIGLAVAHAFAAEGAGIVIASRNQAMLEQAAGEVRRKHNAKVAAHPADLSECGRAHAPASGLPRCRHPRQQRRRHPRRRHRRHRHGAVAAGLAAQGVRLHPSVPALRRQHEGAQVRHHRQHHRHGRPRRAARLHLRGGRQWRPDRLHQCARRRDAQLQRARVRHQSGGHHDRPHRRAARRRAPRPASATRAAGRRRWAPTSCPSGASRRPRRWRRWRPCCRRRRCTTCRAW